MSIEDLQTEHPPRRTIVYLVGSVGLVLVVWLLANDSLSSPFVSIPIILAMTTAFGIFNGLAITLLRIPPVVETVGIKVDQPYAMIDLFGTPYTEKLRLVERYRMVDYAEAKDGLERGFKEAPMAGFGT